MGTEPLILLGLAWIIANVLLAGAMMVGVHRREHRSSRSKEPGRHA